MKIAFQRVSLIAATAALTVLTGCGHMSERQQNTAVGAGVGAAAGAVLSGGSVVGAGVGAVVGGAVGHEAGK